MYDIYTTISGDTWDLISYKVYGSEFYINKLIKENIKYIDIIIFKGGIEIKCPSIDIEVTEPTVPWR